MSGDVVANVNLERCRCAGARNGGRTREAPSPQLRARARSCSGIGRAAGGNKTSLTVVFTQALPCHPMRVQHADNVVVASSARPSAASSTGRAPACEGH